jgi:hypothetical protein
MLNAIGYDGPISIEWEDAGMDRLPGAPPGARLCPPARFRRPHRSLRRSLQHTGMNAIDIARLGGVRLRSTSAGLASKAPHQPVRGTLSGCHDGHPSRLQPRRRQRPFVELIAHWKPARFGCRRRNRKRRCGRLRVRLVPQLSGTWRARLCHGARFAGPCRTSHNRCGSNGRSGTGHQLRMRGERHPGALDVQCEHGCRRVEVACTGRLQ